MQRRDLREVLGIALGQAAERPGSVVRLWVQGRDIETTRMVGEARSVKAHGSGRRARVEHESRWTAEELVVDDGRAAEPSPASAALADRRGHRPRCACRAACEGPRLLIVVTDAFEVSDFGSFECDALPTPERFARTLARERVLPPGSLRGISVIFSTSISDQLTAVAAR
jgi:hypothetical protein